MTVTASVFFMGEYRPAYFEADTVDGAAEKLMRALYNVEDRLWYAKRIGEARQRLENENCAAYACEHGCRGVAITKRPHDPWLDSVTAKLPPKPGLCYLGAVNQVEA